MPISCTYKFNPRKLSDQLQMKERGQALERSMTEMVREIVKRTESGKEIEGAAFKKYTPEYAAWKFGPKRLGGRNRGGYTKGQTSEMQARGVKFAKGKGKAWGWHVPDLTLTGKMLANITSRVKVAKDKLIGTIFFSSAAQATKAIGNQGKRPFFGLSQDQKTRLMESIRNIWR